MILAGETSCWNLDHVGGGTVTAIAALKLKRTSGRSEIVIRSVADRVDLCESAHLLEYHWSTTATITLSERGTYMSRKRRKFRRGSLI